MGYGKEMLPKGATASDMSGQKRGTEKGPNSTKFMSGASGEKMPKGVTASDMSGQRKTMLVGGVPHGDADGIGERDKSHMGKNDGRLGECKGGASESEVYAHSRPEYGR